MLVMAVESMEMASGGNSPLRQGAGKSFRTPPPPEMGSALTAATELFVDFFSGT